MSKKTMALIDAITEEIRNKKPKKIKSELQKTWLTKTLTNKVLNTRKVSLSIGM